MTRLTRLCRTVGVGLAVVTATLAMTQVAHAELPPPTVPDPQLAAPAGNEVFLVGHVLPTDKGVQSYKCVGTTWTFVAPRANLYDRSGKLIIKHFAGPTWQEAPAGSSVVGTKVYGVTVDKTAIPWLLLSATATKTTAGRGGHLLSDTTYIQRLNTIGGLPPASCDPAVDTNQLDVPYTADYYFYKATGKHGEPGEHGKPGEHGEHGKPGA